MTATAPYGCPVASRASARDPADRSAVGTARRSTRHPGTASACHDSHADPTGPSALLAAAATALAVGALAPPATAAPPRTLDGTLVSVAVDERSGAGHVVQHVRVGDRLLPVQGELAEQRTGTRVRVPAEGPVRAGDVRVLEAPARQVAQGVRTVLVVPVQHTARDEQTRATLQDEVHGRVDGWFRSASWGALALGGTATGWQRSAAPLPCGDFVAMTEVGAAAARAAGHDPGAYDSVVVYASRHDCPPDRDEAEISGRWVVLRGQLAHVVHELGHNLGLGHAGSVHCTAADGRPVVLGGTCWHDEYGDAYDAMGIQEHAFSAPHAARLGWLDGRVRTVTSSGTTWLRAYERAGSGTVAVRVEAGYRTYWLEARRRLGVDRALPDGVTDGALVHLEDFTSTTLLDLTPLTPGQPDQDLAPGRTWTDPERGVRIAVGTRTRAGLPVTVTYLPGFAPPVRDLDATAGPEVRLTWSGWPGRTPNGVAVRRSGADQPCPGTPTAGTAVGGTAWRTSARATVAAGEFACFSVFARYEDRWSAPASVSPGCGAGRLDAALRRC